MHYGKSLFTLFHQIKENRKDTSHQPIFLQNQTLMKNVSEYSSFFLQRLTNVTHRIKKIKIIVSSPKVICAFLKRFFHDCRPKLVLSKELQNIFTNIMTMFFQVQNMRLEEKHEEYIWLCRTCQVIWLQFQWKWLSSRLYTKEWKRNKKNSYFTSHILLILI